MSIVNVMESTIYKNDIFSVLYTTNLEMDTITIETNKINLESKAHFIQIYNLLCDDTAKIVNMNGIDATGKNQLPLINI
jgi:hypothetical protein